MLSFCPNFKQMHDYEVMPWRAEVFTNWRSFKSLMPPVISLTVHSDIQGGIGFPGVLFSTLATRYQVDHILRSTIGVSFKLDPSTTGRCGCLRQGYHFACLTSWSATGFAFTKSLIDVIWLKPSPHKIRLFGRLNDMIGFCEKTVLRLFDDSTMG